MPQVGKNVWDTPLVTLYMSLASCDGRPKMCWDIFGPWYVSTKTWRISSMISSIPEHKDCLTASHLLCPPCRDGAKCPHALFAWVMLTQDIQTCRPVKKNGGSPPTIFTILQVNTKRFTCGSCSSELQRRSLPKDTTDLSNVKTFKFNLRSAMFRSLRVRL